jgi:hypothetical protein
VEDAVRVALRQCAQHCTHVRSNLQAYTKRPSRSVCCYHFDNCWWHVRPAAWKSKNTTYEGQSAAPAHCCMHIHDDLLPRCWLLSLLHILPRHQAAWQMQLQQQLLGDTCPTYEVSWSTLLTVRSL